VKPSPLSGHGFRIAIDLPMEKDLIKAVAGMDYMFPGAYSEALPSTAGSRSGHWKQNPGRPPRPPHAEPSDLVGNRVAQQAGI